MALQINLTDNSTDLTIPLAYAKILSFHGDKDEFKFILAFYASGQARLDNKSPISYRDYTLPTADVTGVASLYAYLKTLPDFTSSLDV